MTVPISMRTPFTERIKTACFVLVMAFASHMSAEAYHIDKENQFGNGTDNDWFNTKAHFGSHFEEDWFQRDLRLVGDIIERQSNLGLEFSFYSEREDGSIIAQTYPEEQILFDTITVAGLERIHVLQDGININSLNSLGVRAETCIIKITSS